MTDNPAWAAMPFRSCVGVMLLNRHGLAFIGNRISSDHFIAWQMPQGGIDRGEDARAAALRELREEAGTDKAEFLAEHPDWLTYDLPAAVMGRALHGRYRGQRQKWFAMRFTGIDADIDIATEIPEFNQWRWAPLDEVLDLIVDFKRPVYQRVIETFRPLADRLAREA